MKVGDQIQVQPCDESGVHHPVTATVVYIHPKRNYYTAEYQLHPGGTKIRESFQFAHRRGEG